MTKIGKLATLIVITGVLAAGVLIPYVGGAGLVAKTGAEKFLNTSCTLKEQPVQQRTTLYASDGKTVIATLFDQNRVVIPFKSMPKTVINALVSTEDKRFYQHHGVDLHGLARAALHTSSGNTQGASTLTEQYVKQANYYKAITNGDQAAATAAIDQNIDRKISDAKCALEIEKVNSKDQILEKYLNIAFFGENSYGIQTAAQTYFGVPASNLDIAQGALLVGLVKSPSSLDPYVDPGAARSRRDLVIGNMADQGFISQAQADKAKASPIKLAKQSQPPRGCAYANPAIANVGFFCDFALDWLEGNVDNGAGGLSPVQLNTGGYKIVTTLDVGLQNQGQTAVWNSGLDPKNDYMLAMPSVNPQSGAVTTMVTTKKYGLRKTDPAYSVDKLFTKAYAGAGSTYKYFTALAALKAGVPANFGLNAPSPYQVRNCPQKSYRPQNAGSYRSFLPLNQALPESSNTYFVAMEDQLFGCDVKPIVDTATGLGMNYLTNTKISDGNGGKISLAQAIIADRRPTFTLGQEATSVLQLTGAFSALANDGVFCPPTPIVSITDTAGKAVPFKRLGCSRQFDPYVARTLVNIMTADTNGDGTATSFFRDWYNNGGSPVAGKTGTNNSTVCSVPGDPNSCADDGGNSALWFVGITPNFVSAAAMVNAVNPNQRIANVPGITVNNEGTDTFGATVSKFWLQAYGPTLAAQHWAWPTAASTAGEQVPPVTGMDVPAAQAVLQQAGFKAAVLPTKCGSAVQFDNVAYFSPAIAVPGATISLCQSNGTAPDTYVPPVKTPSKSTAPPNQGPNNPAPSPTRRRGRGG
jgi:membrane peptidoglycan carboxypeptidase